MENIFYEAEKIFFVSENILFTTKNIFAVSEKTVGEAPAIVFHQQPTIRSCEKMGAYATSACNAVFHMSWLAMDIPEDWLNLSQ
jgi:hypothetical protein